MFFSNSAWISASSSGKSKPKKSQSSSVHSSSGTDSTAASHVDISGVKPERAVRLLEVGVGVAVGRVELGRDVRVVARDGGFGVVTDHGLVEHVVG